jgi:hypothetical protein
MKPGGLVEPPGKFYVSGVYWAVTHKPVLAFTLNQKPHNIVRVVYRTNSPLLQIFLVMRLFFCVKTALQLSGGCAYAGVVLKGLFS